MAKGEKSCQVLGEVPVLEAGLQDAVLGQVGDQGWVGDARERVLRHVQDGHLGRVPERGGRVLVWAGQTHHDGGGQLVGNGIGREAGRWQDLRKVLVAAAGGHGAEVGDRKDQGPGE